VATPAPDAAVRGGVRIGRVLGVPVLVSPSWLLFAGLIVVSYGPTLSERFGTTRAYVGAAAFAVLLLLSVLLHEIGHCAVARAFDLPVRSITVTFLAGLTEITEPPQTPAREYAVAVVGPLVSLLLAGIGIAALPLFAAGSLPFLLVVAVAVSNGLVAAFNLLPGLPLDGGRVLRAAVWRLTGDGDRATRAAAWAGRAVGVVVVPVLLLVVLPALGVTGVSVVTVAFTALVGAFVYLGASAALDRERVLSRLSGVSVAALARPALEVPADLPLAEAVRRAQDAGLRAVVVTDGAGRVRAVVSEAAVQATPEDRRPWVAVDAVARRVEDALLLAPSLSGEQLLAAMRATPASEYLVAQTDPGDPGMLQRRAPVRVLVAADVARAAAP
jgi:Zn-dependent protease